MGKLIVGLCVVLFLPWAYSDEALYGVWIPIRYNIGGKAAPLRGSNSQASKVCGCPALTATKSSRIVVYR